MLLECFGLGKSRSNQSELDLEGCVGRLAIEDRRDVAG